MSRGVLWLVAIVMLLPSLAFPATETNPPQADHRHKTPTNSGQTSKSTQPEAPATKQSALPENGQQQTPPIPEQNQVGVAQAKPEREQHTWWESSLSWEMIAAILAALGLMAWFITELRNRGEKRENVRREASKYLELVSLKAIRKKITAGVNTKDAGLIKDFLIGKSIDTNCLLYVYLDLDARREHLLSSARKMLIQERSGPHCIQIVGARQQGKTMLMARLAFDLAKAGARVYWCWADRSKEARQQWSLLKSFFQIKPWYWRWSSQRTYVFIDDIFSPDELAEDTAVTEQDARNIIDALGDTHTTVVTSCVKSIFPSLAIVDSIGVADGERNSDLDMNEADAKAIVNKWREKGHLTEDVAREFLNDLKSKKLYSKRIFAFLSLLFEKAGEEGSADFMVKFTREFIKIEYPEKNLLPIASCQVVGVPVPRCVIHKIDHSFEMDHSIVTQAYHQGNSEDVVYVMEGLFLPIWLLRKVRIEKFQDLEATYGMLIDACRQERNFGIRPSESSFLPHLFHELARGVNEDIVGGEGEDVARTVFNQHKDFLVTYFQQTVRARKDQTELILWGWAFKSLLAWDLADEAYLAAVDCLSPNPTLTDRLRLINGLKELKSEDSRRRAIPIAEALLDELINDKKQGQLACEVFTSYCYLLRGHGEAKKGLDKWAEYRASGAIKPDALLYTTIGSLYEKLGDDHVQDAGKAYFEATLQRGPGTENSPAAVHAIQRYANFLENHPSFDLTIPEALKLAETGNIGAETIFPFQAEVEEHRRNYQKARDLFTLAIEGYRMHGIVEGHAWSGLATLLIDHTERFSSESPDTLLQEAETLLEEVESDKLCEQRSRRIALKIHGDLVAFTRYPYTYKNRERPDLEEGKSLLTSAFESPPSLRDDPETKTFHDARVHSSLAQVYYRQTNMAYQNVQTSGDLAHVQELAACDEYHTRMSFEGLPRRDTPEDKVKEFVLRRRAQLALFIWRDKPRYFPGSGGRFLQDAEALYLENVNAMESYGWGFPVAEGKHLWVQACEAYLNFAWLRCVNKGEVDEKLLHACKATTACLPAAKITHSGLTNQLKTVIQYLIEKSEIPGSAPESSQREALSIAELAETLAKATRAKTSEDAWFVSRLQVLANEQVASLTRFIRRWF